jgi:hypothetical protein
LPAIFRTPIHVPSGSHDLNVCIVLVFPVFHRMFSETNAAIVSVSFFSRSVSTCQDARILSFCFGLFPPLYVSDFHFFFAHLDCVCAPDLNFIVYY